MDRILSAPADLDKVSGARCAVCGAEARHPLALSIDFLGTPRDVYRCRNCGTHFYDPMPDPDYGSHTDDLTAERFYVEHDANIGLMLERIAPAMQARSSGSFLDIGCGYGFAVDMARHLFGWDVYGVEPSAYGRHGSEALGFPLLNRMLTFDDPFAGRKFDVIHSSEVIEHTHDPVSFVDLILQYLTADGCAVLTTPSADAATDPKYGIPRRLAFLSPGFHAYLFTKDSLGELLRSRGFRQITIECHDGTLIAYASRERLKLKQASDPNEMLWRYYESGLARVPPDSMTGMGFGARYFSSLVSHGQFDSAQRVWDRMSLKLPDKLPCTLNLAEFIDVMPVAACELAYMRAMLLFHEVHRPRRLAAMLGMSLGTAQLAEAVHLFGMAFAIARRRLDINPALANTEAALFWPARFHEALALHAAGERDQAASIAREMLEPDSYPTYRPIVPAIDDDLIRRIEHLLK